MDFLCPNCQKMLTVPDQYAGTKMKCPLCSATFTAPSLAPPPGSSSAPPGPGPFPPPPPPPPTSVPLPTREPDRTASPPPPTPGDYRGGFGFALNPKVVQWIAPAAMVLIWLLLIFTPWVGMYPGGYTAYSQGVGQAAFGGLDMSNQVWSRLATEYGVGGDEPRAREVVTPVVFADASKFPFNVPLWFYLLLFFPLALAVSIVAAVLPMVTLRLPPFVDQIRPWRWAIAAGVLLIPFLLLCIQAIAGFGLEDKVREGVEAKLDPIKERAKTPTPEEQQMLTMARDSLQGAQQLHRTIWFRLTFFLHIVAVAAAGLQFWLDRRVQQGKPIPRLDIRW